MARKKQQKQLTQESKPQELQVTLEQQKTIDTMLSKSEQTVEDHWSSSQVQTIMVPVDDGEIRVLHNNPPNKHSKRPVVFVPGWGVIPSAFDVLYEVLHKTVEFYYIETREKGSSKITSRKADMSVLQSAKDIEDTLSFLGLSADDDYLLAGPCWGATIILEGLLAKKYQDAPQIVLFDPMHKLWFPKILLILAKVIPAFVVQLLKPILKFFAFLGMKEKSQKQRSQSLVDNADPWKWKTAAHQARDIELFGKISSITREILVFNGTNDKVHEQSDYPKLTKELPHGRFFFMNTSEANRERLHAIVIQEFSYCSSTQGVPNSLRGFEKNLSRKTS